MNIQSIIAKFTSLYALLVDLADKRLYISAICPEKSWLSVNSEVSLLQIPNHKMKMFHQGKSRCSNRGGLLTYGNCKYSCVPAVIRNQFRRALIWEDQLIDQRGIINYTHEYFQHISTPQNNDNNANIENFTGELTPIITDLSKSCNTSLAAVNFNINLLQLNGRENMTLWN